MEKFITDDVIEIGKANIVRDGTDIAIFSFGSLLDKALDAGESLNATVIDMRFIKPLDEKLIFTISKSHSKLISIEDNASAGGAGSAINELLQQNGIKTPLSIVGLPDTFSEHGSQEELYDLYGLNAKNLINIANQKWKKLWNATVQSKKILV